MAPRKTGMAYIISPLALDIKREDYCGFSGECKRTQSQQYDLCYICKHLKRIDIADLLNREYNRVIKDREDRIREREEKGDE